MLSIATIAKQFFEACETGKGWAVCREWCTPEATFAAQAEPLADVRTLQQYTEWMKGLLTFIPDGRFELKSFATDDERNNVSAYAVFRGTHTGEGGPCPDYRMAGTDRITSGGENHDVRNGEVHCRRIDSDACPFLH